jgi:hypothetical protein
LTAWAGRHSALNRRAVGPDERARLASELRIAWLYLLKTPTGLKSLSSGENRFRVQTVLNIACSMVRACLAFFRARRQLAIEVLALRQQLGVLRRSVKRRRLTSADPVVSNYSRRLDSRTIRHPGTDWNGAHSAGILRPPRCFRCPSSSSS